MKFYNHQTTSINQMRKTALNAYVCWCNAQKINRKILTARGRSRIKSVKDGPSPNHPPNHEKIGPKNLTPPSPQKFTGWSQNLRSFTQPPTHSTKNAQNGNEGPSFTDLILERPPINNSNLKIQTVKNKNGRLVDNDNLCKYFIHLMWGILEQFSRFNDAIV
jgi:hypothetical protein